MQKIVLLLAFLILSSLSLFAQEKTGIKNKHIEAHGTHFATSVKDKKWKNENGSSFTKAKYAAYDGETFIKINTSKDVIALLRYEIKVSEGELEMFVVDSQDKVLFQKSFSEDSKSETEVSFKKDQEYKIKFIGRQTSGSYFCQWIEK